VRKLDIDFNDVRIIVMARAWVISDNRRKQHMSNLETPEDLLVTQSIKEISPEHYGEPVVVEFAPTEKTTLARSGGVVPSETSVEPAKPFQPVETTIAEVPTSRGKIRWWDLFFIALNAYLGWFIFCFLFGLVGGILYVAMGYGTDLDAFTAAASRNFYFTQIATASFYLTLLLAMRRVLRKRRGRGSFAGYFRPIGGRRLLYAALSGLVAAGVVVLLLAVLWSTAHWPYHRKAADVIGQPYSVGQLAIWGLIAVVLAPLTEEMFFRGLLLEWLQQRLARLPSALVTATIFALWHLRFLQFPGIAGWIATAEIGALGLLCALWAQRAGSLYAPVTAHAAYNATLTLTLALAAFLLTMA
jgi:membrane protease YdiL (CAAX protease family)